MFNERIENGSSVENKNDTNLNTTGSTYLKSNKNDIANRIANYAEYYFQSRRPDSYYFGRNSSFIQNYGHKNYHYYYSDGNKDGNRKSSVIRPSNPSNDAMYMIETYFKPWIESSLNRIKSPEIPSKST